MSEVCLNMGYGENLKKLARSQDEIGRRDSWKGWFAKKLGKQKKNTESLADHGCREYVGQKNS